MNAQKIFVFYLLSCLVGPSADPSVAQVPEGATLVERKNVTPEQATGPRGSLDFQGHYSEENQQGRLRVRSIVPGGAAEKAGLLKGDVVLAFDGVDFRFRDDLERVEHFDDLLPGDQVEVQLLRGGKPMTLVIIASGMPLEWIRGIEETRAEAKYRRQYLTLNQLGRGKGVVIDVVRDSASLQLTYSAPGFPSATFQYMQDYIDTTPLQEYLAALPLGQHVGLKGQRTGRRLDVTVLAGEALEKERKVP